MKNIPHKIQEELRQVAKVISQANKALRNGEKIDIDIDSLDEKLSDILAEISSLPEDSQPEATPYLNTLSSNLMEISIALKTGRA